MYQGLADLEKMEDAANYNRWLFSQAAPYLGERVLEIGCGIGTYLGFALALDKAIMGIELDAACLDLARQRYADAGDVSLVQGDINDADTMEKAKAFEPDSAYCFNVLEHIEDDRQGLAHIAEILAPRIPIVIIVPAFPCLYGANDRLVGHYRRYTRADLSSKLMEAGFEIVDIYYMNSIGFFAWFILNRVLKQEHQSGSQIGIYDRVIVPFLRRIEGHWHPPIGQSLVAVARRKQMRDRP